MCRTFCHSSKPKEISVPADKGGVLCDCCSGHHYCPAEHRTWQSRWSRIQTELQHYNADLLCLQEVSPSVSCLCFMHAGISAMPPNFTMELCQYCRLRSPCSQKSSPHCWRIIRCRYQSKDFLVWATLLTSNMCRLLVLSSTNAITSDRRYILAKPAVACCCKS